MLGESLCILQTQYLFTLELKTILLKLLLIINMIYQCNGSSKTFFKISYYLGIII